MTDQLRAGIENLESQNRRIKGVVTGLCLDLIALLMMGLGLPQTTGNTMERIEAREIVLSDGSLSARLTPDR